MKRQVAGLLEIIEGFKGKKVLLIGDPILDIYVYGKALGISSETPTVVAAETGTDVTFGGSSLVARNLLELGAMVTDIAVTGDDAEAGLYEGLKHKNLKKHFITEPNRRTTVKKRFWVDGYKLLQLDNLDNRDIGQETVEGITSKIKLAIAGHDLIVIADNQHGMMTDDLINTVRDLSLEYHKNVYVDSQASQRVSNAEKYRDFHFICLNREEANQLDSQFGDNELFENLKKKLGNANICVKLGESGSVALVINKLVRTAAIKVKAVDTCGAGDAFLAALSIGNPSLPAESLYIANVWAGLSVTKHGINPPERKELVSYIAGLED